jgi:hypothetical protein
MAEVPPTTINAITTDESVHFYLNGYLLFETEANKVFDVPEYLRGLCAKVASEYPGQIYSPEYSQRRTTAGELGLLILQGMSMYREVSDVVTTHFVPESMAAILQGARFIF